jgi:fibronectin type 3 domain-containing protein
MRNKYLFPIFLFLGFLVISCNKDKESDYKKSGFSSSDEILKNPEVKKAIKEAGINIYPGTNPPSIVGEFRTDSCSVVGTSTNLNQMYGLPLRSTFKFSNQTNGSIIVSEKGDNGEYSNGSGAFITGEGNYYSLFIEATNSDGSNVIAIQSGEVLTGGKINMKNVTTYTLKPPSNAVVGDWWKSEGPLMNLKYDAPDVPQNVDAAYSNGCVSITWNSVDNAASYRVYKSTNPDGAYSLLQTATTSNTSVCTNLEEGVTYYFEISAVSEYDIESKKSNYSSVTIPSSITAPTGLKVTYSSATGCMNINWNTVSGAKSYKLYYSNSSTGTYNLVKTVTTNSTTVCLGLTEGTIYYYKVSSVGSNDIESDKSEYASAKATGSGGGGIIDSPTGLSAEFNASSGCVVLSWNSVSEAVKYNLYYGYSESGTYYFLKTETNTSTTDCDDLTDGTTYYYRVTALNSNDIESELSGYDYITVNNGPTTDVTFTNALFTDIYITLGSDTKTIEPSGSVTFYGVTGSSAHYSAYTYGATKDGTQVGLKITWDNDLALSGGTTSNNLILTGSYFFIYIKNTSNHVLGPLYVNYGLQSETKDDIVISNDGVKYRIGYYKAWSNSNVRGYYQDAPSSYYYWNQGEHFNLPFTDNQSITLLCLSSKSSGSDSQILTQENKVGFVTAMSAKVFNNKDLNQIILNSKTVLPAIEYPKLDLSNSRNEYCK